MERKKEANPIKSVSKANINRREFLKLGGVALGGLLIGGPKESFLFPELPSFSEHPTPPSLMLHKWADDLVDSSNLLTEIKERFRPITYKQFFCELMEEKKKNGNGGSFSVSKPEIIVSLDDVSVARVEGKFISMVEKFLENDIKLVLGVNTPFANAPDAVNQLARWASLGVELGLHTSNHKNLNGLDGKEIKYEIMDNYLKVKGITEKAGVPPPETLILPYGTGQGNKKVIEVCECLGINFIVGIAEGRTIEGKPPFYVGRVAPYADTEKVNETLDLLESSFGLFSRFSTSGLNSY